MATRHRLPARLLPKVAAALLAATLPLSACSAQAGPRTTPSAPLSTSRMAPSAPLPGPQLLQTVPPDAFPLARGGDIRFGVAQAVDAAPQADALHVRWERMPIIWDLMQPHGPLDWNVLASIHDQPIDTELARGRQIVGILEGCPRWAEQHPSEGNRSAPRNIDLPWNDPRNYWGQYVYRAARHYAGRINTFTILNEINIPNGSFAGTSAQYAQMLRVAYLAAHAANPHVEIHIYGDNMYADYGVYFSHVMDVLASFPDARANNLFFDAAEVHLYDGVLRWDYLFKLWRQAMQRHNVDKPIWISEFNVAPRDDPGHTAVPSGNNAPLSIQPNYIIQAFAAGLGLGSARMEVYIMRDGKNPADGSGFNGLVRYNGTFRPEAWAYATATTWFNGVTASRYDPGSEPTDDSRPVFRATMERPGAYGQPGQEIQVLWNQSGKGATAAVPALSPTARVVRPDGSVSTVQAIHGAFTVRVAPSLDKDPAFPHTYDIGGVPLIVVQNLPRGYHAPGLHPLFVERNRALGATDALGTVTSIATDPIGPLGMGPRAIADTSHDRVIVEDAAGRVTACFGATGGAPGLFRGPTGVAIGSDGTLYVADQGNARIQEFDLSGHLLGGFGSYLDASNPAASLHAPTAVAVAPDNTVYVVDAARNAVLHFTRVGRFLGGWGSPGNGIGQFDAPSSIAVSPQGNVYVSDTLNNRVTIFDAAGHPTGQIGTGDTSGPASLHWPTAVAITGDGRVAITDADNGRVIVASRPQTYLGAAALPRIAQPGGMAIATDGSYYVSDTANNRIVHLKANGLQLAAFGTAGRGQGQFFAPGGLAFGPDGNLYVADGGNNRIQVLTPSGGFVRAFGRQGNAPGQFLGPHEVAVDRDGTVWVADTFNARVEHLTATGAIIDATHLTHINGAFGVAPDGHGGVYYSARYDMRVYHWTPGGGQQVWGGFGSSSNQFDHPSALVATPDGSVVYVVDDDNMRVQFITGGRVAGHRGDAGATGAGLTKPIAIAMAPDGSIAVLDATEHRAVRYQGATAGAIFQLPIANGASPLGLTAYNAHGLIASVVDPLTGISSEQRLSPTSGQ